MPDLVRIRDPKTKVEVTVGRRRAEQLVERGGELVETADATDRLGRALPATEAITKTKTATTSKEATR